MLSLDNSLHSSCCDFRTVKKDPHSIQSLIQWKEKILFLKKRSRGYTGRPYSCQGILFVFAFHPSPRRPSLSDDVPPASRLEFFVERVKGVDKCRPRCQLCLGALHLAFAPVPTLPLCLFASRLPFAPVPTLPLCLFASRLGFYLDVLWNLFNIPGFY